MKIISTLAGSFARSLARLTAFLGFLMLPGLASAQSTGVTTFQSLANTIVKILDYGAVLLIAATLVIYFYTIVGNIFRINQSEASGAQLRSVLLRGILVLFLMVSIWGIIQFLQYSLFGGPPPAATNGVVIYQ